MFARTPRMSTFPPTKTFQYSTNNVVQFDQICRVALPVESARSSQECRDERVVGGKAALREGRGC